MKKIYAVLSDIHGNYSALQAVEKDARAIARQEKANDLQFVCLGDVVDYGPQPNKCVEWVLKHASVMVQGNHDRMAIGPKNEPPYGINSQYWPITQWTRQKLLKKHQDAIRQKFISPRFPDSWPPTLPGQESFVLFHSSLIREDERVDINKTAQENLDWLKKHSFKYGLFGHTHLQGFFTTEYDQGMNLRVVRFFTWPGDIKACPGNEESKAMGNWKPLCLTANNEWKALSKYRRAAIFNPGGVGQPRQPALLTQAGGPEDYRAAYMLFCFNKKGEGKFLFRRVSYKVKETVALMRKQVYWDKNTKDPLEGHSDYHPQRPIVKGLNLLVEETLIPTLTKDYQKKNIEE